MGTTTADPSTATGAYEVRTNAVCSNGCGGSDPSYWCGTNKKDSSGKVVRCVELTVNGEYCVGSCEKKGKTYYWCLTNAIQLQGKGSDEWWDYCSVEGYTTKHERCTDRCGKNGEKYYWCQTDKEDTSKGDYCSPRGRDRPIQYTVKGSLCTSECGKKGEKYYWCYKSKSYCSSRNCDDSWDYCSTSEYKTRYGTKCLDRCGRKGKDYNWCKIADGSWEYCSASPRMGVDVSDHIELTIHGVKCLGKCNRQGARYYWCNHLGGEQGNDKWDYCSPDPKLTIYREKCTDSCTTRGESYNWCHTTTDWDYFPPRGTRGNTREYSSSSGWAVLFWLFMIPVIIICCIVLKKACC